MAVVKELIGFRYLTRFECIGPACEDPCCAGWAVPVDEEHFKLLAERMTGTPEERAEFERALEPVPEAAATCLRVADMALDAAGRCAMFGADNLCSIQKRYGEELLPDTCALYPRAQGRVDERVEITGLISCPEVARLCLLADDAVDLVPLPPSKLVRRLVYKQVSTDTGEPYERCFEEVRATSLDLMTRPYPMASRLMFLAFFADQTAAELRRGATPDRATLDEHRGLLASATVLEQLHRKFEATDVTEPFALSVVLQVLLADRPGRARVFVRLTARVLLGYPEVTPGGDLDVARLWDAYRARRDALPAAVHERLERYLHNYCVNQLVQDWYTGAPSFVASVQSLLVAVAVIRFLLIGHPELARAAAATTPEEQRAILDAAAVETFYGFARAVQQDTELTTRIVAALAEQGLQTLPHAVCLLKL